MLIEMGNNMLIQNILFLRKKYSLSRRGLAKLMGIREYHLRGMEEELIPTVFTHEQLVRLSQIFNISIEELASKPLS